MSRSSCRSPSAGRVSCRSRDLADGLDLDLQADLLGDYDPTGLQGHVPRQPPVLPVDRAPGGEHGPIAAPRVTDVAKVVDLQGDRPGDSLDGQLAIHGAAAARPQHLAAAVGGGRVGAGVEEVGGAQVVVAGLVAGVDTRHVDGDLDLRLLGVLGDGDGAVHASEPATDLGEHEVPADEADLGMARVNGPGAGGGQLDSIQRAGWGYGHGFSLLST